MSDKSFFRPPVYGLILLFSFFLLLVLYCVVSAIVTSRGYEELLAAAEAQKSEKRMTVILDAGHGGADPGAVANGCLEKDINLAVTGKVRDFLLLSGYDVVLTRSDDSLLGIEYLPSSKKHDDLVNRIAYASRYDNCIFVSIHANKFAIPQLHGLQTFYSENDPRSKILAQSVQESTTALVMPDNTRKIKPGNDTIFILEQAPCPAILIECGFLSNPQEALKLSNDDYQSRLAFSIYKGLTDYLEVQSNEDGLCLQ